MVVERDNSSELPQGLVTLLERFVSPVSAKAMVRAAIIKAERTTGAASTAAVLRQLELSANILIPPSQRQEALDAIRAELQRRPLERASKPVEPDRSRPAPAPAPEPAPEPEPEVGPEETVVIVRQESDLNHARMLAREACGLVGLRGYAAQKIVTAVSELARNIARYVGEGKICFRIDIERCCVVIVARDRGPGIANIDDVLAGRYRSRTGLGRGLIGVRNLADEFDIQTSPRGTTVTVGFKYP